MGCCESREELYQGLEKFQNSEKSTNSASPSPSFVDAPFEQDSYISDSKLQQIIDYSEEAIHSNIWKTSSNDDNLTAKTTQGSPFNAAMPVAYLKLEINKAISPEIVLAYFTEFEKRRLWDADIVEMYSFQELTPYEDLLYTSVDFKIFFLNKREMIERRYIAVEANRAIMASYSIEHQDYPRNAHLMRQEIPFASIQVVQTETTTEMHLLFQFINNKFNSDAVWRVTVGKLVRWAKRFNSVFNKL